MHVLSLRPKQVTDHLVEFRIRIDFFQTTVACFLFTHCLPKIAQIKHAICWQIIPPTLTNNVFILFETCFNT